MMNPDQDEEQLPVDDGLMARGAEGADGGANDDDGGGGDKIVKDRDDDAVKRFKSKWAPRYAFSFTAPGQFYSLQSMDRKGWGNYDWGTGKDKKYMDPKYYDELWRPLYDPWYMPKDGGKAQ